MKKCLILLLACVMILSSCAPALALGFLFGGGSGGSMRYVSVPEKAIEGLVYARVVAGNADGSKLLIDSQDSKLFLWDVQKGERIPVSLPRTQDAEALTQAMMMGTDMFMKLKREQREAYLQNKQEAMDEYLTAHGLTVFENLDQIVDCLAQDGRYVYRSRCTALNGRFALVEYGSAICLGIDLETGKAYAVNGLSGIYPALCENRVLCSEGFLDLATGEVSIPEEPEGWTGEDETMKDLEIAAASRVLMLPGELRFLGVYYTAWERTENDMLRTEYLILRDLNGVSRCVSLGECSMSKAADQILLTENERYALVLNSSTVSMYGANLVDLTAGEVRHIDGLLPVGAAGDKFLCYDMKQYKPCLLDPATGKTEGIRTVTSPGDPEWVGPITPFMGAAFNGKLLFPQRERYQGYLILG